ncbi:PHP domain-containing protein [bacterium]|nr:PHP domain-containing protein [bacterium]
MKVSGRLNKIDQQPIPKQLSVNLHVHSAFSDGQFTPEALVIQAIESGISVLGISDHYFTRKTPSIKPVMLVKYLDELDRLASLYRDKITILKAIEINTLELFLMGLSLPENSLMKRLDYVLLEYVANIPRAGIPLQHAILIAKEIPVICGLAHTDLAMAFPNLTPEELVNRLTAADIFIELNEAYRRPGEREPFYNHFGPYLETAWTTDLKFSVGSDAHNQIQGGAIKAMEYLKKFGLNNRLFYSNLQKSGISSLSSSFSE